MSVVPILRLAVLGGLAIAGAARSRSVDASPITVPVSFSGPAQNMNLAATAGGEVGAELSGTVFGASIVLDPNPQVQPIIIDPNPAQFVTQPVSLPHDINNLPAQTELDLDDANWDLLAIRNLNMDLTNGFIAQIDAEPIIATTLLAGFPFNFVFNGSVTAKDMYFFQTGPSSVLGSNFSVPGMAQLTVSLTVLVGGTQPPFLEYVDSVLPPLPVTVTGTYSRSILPGANPRDVLVELDATGMIATNYGLLPGPFHFVSPGAYDISGTFGVDLPITYEGDVHLETVLVDAHVPEPASIAVFGLGALLVFSGVASKRRLRSRA